MDGYPIYQGPARDSTKYFEGIGFQIPTHANPADFISRSSISLLKYQKKMNLNY